MSITNYQVVLKPGTYDKKLAGRKQPGLDLERVVTDYLLAKGLVTNPSKDCCTMLPAVNTYNTVNTSVSLKASVQATSKTVTTAFASNTLTVNKPIGVAINSLKWRIFAADVQATTDGSVTNWVKVVITNTTGNTGVTDLNVPFFSKVSIPATGILSVTNAANYDLDNIPQIDVIGAALGTITLRISGLAALPAQGFLLQLSNIY